MKVIPPPCKIYISQHFINTYPTSKLYPTLHKPIPIIKVISQPFIKTYTPCKTYINIILHAKHKSSYTPYNTYIKLYPIENIYQVIPHTKHISKLYPTLHKLIPIIKVIS
ncbi:hypothetical protein V8G54_009791, partial [Vigna mungo]